MTNAGADNVAEKQERDRQAKKQLHHFPAAHLQAAALCNFVKSQTHMHHQCRAQDRRAESGTGYRNAHGAKRFHGVDGNKAQSVVEKMR